MVKVLETASVLPELLSDDEQYWLYNGADCCVTYQCWEELKPKEEEAEATYRMARAMQGPAWTLMHRGVRIDLDTCGEVRRDLHLERVRLENTFLSICAGAFDIGAINYRSPKQLAELFYETIGLEPIKVFDRGTKEYKSSLNREALEKLQRLPIVKHVIDCLLAMRDIDKKLQVLQTPLDNGRMHCSYQVAGTLTGRWSSNASAFGGGTNLQNISDEMRRIFVPDPGMKLCQLDLQQAESKLVAYLCLPWGRNYLTACQSGDLHTTVTQLIWPEMFEGANEKPKDIAKKRFYRDYSYRDMAKRGGHGSNYGGAPTVLSMHLKIPKSQCEVFQNKYYGAFQEIRSWHNHVKVQLAMGKPIETPLGRRCHFPGRSWDNDTIKSAIAYAPQSTIGDILNRGFYNVWRKYDRIWDKKNPIEILLQVHDAIVFQYDPALESTIIPLIMDELTYPVEINGEICTIGVDPQVGWNWGKRKEFRNDRGELVVENEWGLEDWKDSDDRQPPPQRSFLDRRIFAPHVPAK